RIFNHPSFGSNGIEKVPKMIQPHVVAGGRTISLLSTFIKGGPLAFRVLAAILLLNLLLHGLWERADGKSRSLRPGGTAKRNATPKVDIQHPLVTNESKSRAR